MKVLTQKDPLTGEEFVPKRINQRFASAENRIKYNNKEATNLRKERAFVNTPLNKSHRLLRKLMANKNSGVFSFYYLDGYGINFRIQTHSSRINGIKHPSIYDFIIISNIENKTVKIMRDGGY